MTKAVTCPCCRKKFIRISQHFTLRPKCSLFVRKRLLSLDLLPTYQFKRNVILKPEHYVREKDLSELYNSCSGTLTMEEDVACTETVNLGQEDVETEYDFCSKTNDIYNKGISFQRLIASQNLKRFCDPSFRIQLELLKILEDISAPLKTYEKIMDWATNAFNAGYKFPCRRLSRSKMIEKLSDIFCLKKTAPMSSTIRLHSGDPCKVSYFDFEQMCYSLLSDESLMTDSNMSFGNNNPAPFQKQQNSTLSCIEDGDMFQNTMNDVCTEPKDFLLGIKMFIDATHTDIHGDWVLDPVYFTFTFLSNHVTREQRAWRPLGFVNDLNKKSTAWNNHITARNKLIDYHSQLGVIFKSFSECQRRGGFLWDLKTGGRSYKVNMKPVLILIIGDALGNHKLAGMFNNFSNTHRVNHSCNCPLEHTDNPNYVCKFINQSDISLLCDLGDVETLGKLSYHGIRNAFWYIDVATHEAGINAMMPSEILHQLFLGIMENVLDTFILSFPPVARTRMDKFGAIMYHFFKRSSDRSLPRLKTKNGFTNLTRQKGSDRLGFCLLLLIFMLSDFQESFLVGIRYAPSLADRRNYCNIFNKLLCFAQWLSQDSIDVGDLEDVHGRIKDMMYLIKHSVKRETSCGWKISKFHELLHVVRDVRLFGPPQGYDGRPGESSHKDTKQQARRTQMRMNVFESQTSQRIYESLVIRRGCISMGLTHRKKYTGSAVMTGCDETSSSPNYYIIRDSLGKVVISKGKGKKIQSQHIHHISPMHQSVYDQIYDEFSSLFPNEQIPCRSSVFIQNQQIIRATEIFYDGKPWNDWAWVQWDYGDLDMREVPAMIWCFIDLRSVDSRDLEERGLDSSIYAYICSASDQPVLTNFRSISVVKKLSLEQHENELVFRLVNIDSLTKPCFVVPNLTTCEEQELENIHTNWLYVDPRSTWSNHF